MTFTISFNLELAKIAGVKEAILYSWVLSSCPADSKTFVCTFAMLDETFPFWNRSQRGTLCKNLKLAGVLDTKESKDSTEFVLTGKVYRCRKTRKVREVPKTVEEESVRTYQRVLHDGTKETVVTTTGKVVNEMIEMFKEVNPTFDKFYSRNVHRRALESMLDRYSIDFLFKLLGTLKQANATQYAPTITTPLEFERLAPKLVSFLQRKQVEQAEKHNVIM